MSFLSSHRLHWGVHHELSENFWVHLEEMVRATHTTATASNALPAAHADGTAPDSGLTPRSDTPSRLPGT